MFSQILANGGVGVSEQLPDGGQYVIESMLDNNLVLDVSGGTAGDGTPVILWTNSKNPPYQHWRLTKVDEGTDDKGNVIYYTIGTLGDDRKVMEAPGPWHEGDPIVMRGYNPDDFKNGDDLTHRQWVLVPVPGQSNVYKIVNRRSKRCIDVKDGKIEKVEEIELRQYTCWDPSYKPQRQQWKLTPP
jgi:Ricin-type beta-trefoil lectin domain-like